MKSLLLFWAISSAALAHQNNVTDVGKRMFLPNPRVDLQLQNTFPYLPKETTTDIINASLQEWNQIQTNLNLNLVDSGSVFKIRFDSDFSRYGPGVVGITEINYNSEGAIQKATIKLNNNIYFSNSKSAHVMGGVYLGDVISHEVGHLVGLGHSEVMNSTMFFESFPGQFSLSKDDKAGARSLYGNAGGKIKGTIMGGNHIPILGAQVKAISRISGEAISSVSNENGQFEISGLDINDSYYLYVSPTVKINDLPPYFSNTQNNFCPTSYRGGFFTACGIEDGGSAQAVTLTSATRSVDVGVVSINCSLRSSPDYARFKIESESEPIFLWDSTRENINEKNHIGYFFSSESWSQWDKFKLDLTSVDTLGGNRYLRINLISYPFANPLEYELKIMKDGDELMLLGISEDVVTRTFNNNISYDLPLNVHSNEYEIHIRARNLINNCNDGACSRWTFPALDQFVSTQQFPYLLSLGLMEGLGSSAVPLFNTEQLLSDNASCLDGPFAYEVRRNTPLTQEQMKQEVAQMSCGTIEPPSSNPPGGGLMSLCLGFMLASLSLLVKKAKNTLS